jgi:PAS domain S-box-containing protein
MNIYNPQTTKSMREWEEYLEKEEKRLEGLAFFDDEGTIFYASPSTIHITGYSDEEMIGKSAFDYVHPDDLQYARDFFSSLIQKPYETKIIKSRFMHKNGSIRLYKTTLTNMLADPNIHGVVVHFRDITEKEFQSEKIYLLQEITHAIAESKDFNSAIEITLQKVCESTDWCCGEAWIPSEGGAYLSHSNTRYCSIEGMKEFEEESNKYKFPMGVGLPGLAWSSKKPEWMDDITLDDNFPRRHLAIKAGLESAVAIPILADNKVVSVMVFLTTKIKKEDERMIRLISTIASQLGTLFQKKQMENLLQESETTLKNIIESVPVGIAVTTAEGKAVDANPAIVNMLGYESKDEILKIPVINHYHNPYDRERLVRMLQENGFVRDFDVQLKRRDGSLIWCNLNAVAEKGKTGKRFIFSVKDITKDIRKEEEIYLLQTMTQAIAESEDFNSALEAALKRICISTDWGCGEAWIPSRDGKHLEHSRAWYCNNIEGMESFEQESDKFTFPRGVGLPGFAWQSRKAEWRTDVTFDDNFPRKQLAIDAGLKSAVAIPILANNEVVAVMVFLTTEIKRDAERTIRLISIIASQLGTLFQRKKMEDFLRESEAKLKNIMESVSIGVSMSTLSGEVLELNKACLNIFGYDSKEEMLKIPTTAHYYNPEDRDRLINLLQVQGIAKDFEVQLKRKDGALFWCNMNAALQRDGDREYLIVSFADITGHKKYEEYIRHKQKIEALGQLTGGIAHHFNNILAGIMGFAGILRMKMKKDDPLRVNVDYIHEAAKQTAELIRGLLAFSRKHDVINLRQIRLNDIIDNTRKTILKIIRENIKLNMNISGESLTVMADSFQMEQVLINLVTNSQDAMPDGGALTIEASPVDIKDRIITTTGYIESGRYALIKVADTGIGIDENIQKKVFEPFFTTKEVGKGTGLGLAMVYGIIKQHNGYIDLFSEPGKGTIFKVYLPLEPEIGVNEIKPSEAKVFKGGGETILIAEDDALLRKATKVVLESIGYKVIEAGDGREALDKFIQNRDKIKLAIFDVVMPEKDGKEVCDEIMNIAPEIKVLFVSGYSTDTIQMKAIIEKKLDFISKPFSNMEFLRRVREILDRVL